MTESVRHVLTSIALVFATLYVLALPTITSAMTSYQAKSTAVMALADGSTVPVAELIHVVGQGMRQHTEFYYDGPHTGAGRRQNFTQQEIMQNGRCQPLQAYEWGFSFLLVLAFLVLTYVFVIATFLLWQDARFNRRVSAPGARRLGTTSASLEIAAAVRAELGNDSLRSEDEELWTQLKGCGITSRLDGVADDKGTTRKSHVCWRISSPIQGDGEATELKTFGEALRIEEASLLRAGCYG